MYLGIGKFHELNKCTWLNQQQKRLKKKKACQKWGFYLSASFNIIEGQITVYLLKI